jgi:hypothetical protein
MCDSKEGGLKMVSVRAKLQTIAIKNFINVKKNIGRPQYQVSVYWLKFQLRDFIANFNIAPGGDTKDTPIYFQKIIEQIKNFKTLYKDWVSMENISRKKNIDLFNKFNKNNENKKSLIPVEPNFLKNQRILTSKFVYNLFLINIKNIPKFSSLVSSMDQKNVFARLHKLISNSNIFLVNYKFLLNGLPVNKKFNCRYDKICFLCKKNVAEDLAHLFVECEITKKCFQFVSPCITHKNKILSQDLLQLKLQVSDDDFLQLSKFVFAIWRTRNAMKHGNSNFDPHIIFKNIFNCWSISKTSI